ncbi:DUF4352 domain-containing protein [Mycolicibacterium pulveris]|uniref:DUF4352 domain-containing protein n=1 Tax=Mycolicibacterium pulveris TaxID=36813 RepID=UPI003CFB1954
MTTAPPTDDVRRLVLSYAAACSALLAALVLVVVYGLFINETAFVAADDAETETAARPIATSGWVAPPKASPVDAGVDGPMSFIVRGYEADAAGEQVVVNLTVTNVGDAPATFLGTYQTLKADGAVYRIDDAATSALGGGVAELAPGDKADVALAFTVPAGTVPGTVELRADSVSAGVELALS